MALHHGSYGPAAAVGSLLLALLLSILHQALQVLKRLQLLVRLTVSYIHSAYGTNLKLKLVINPRLRSLHKLIYTSLLCNILYTFLTSHSQA